MRRVISPNTGLLAMGWRAVSFRGVATATAKSVSDELTFEVPEYKGHRIDPPSNTVTTTKTELVDALRLMTQLREMELAAHNEYTRKMIRGFCHLYDGQEAIVVGLETALEKTDSVITSYRDHCTHIGRGGTVKEVMGELFGRATGCSRGVGGSMHMYNKKNNFYGGCGIVGAQIPLGAGLALAHKYREDGGVSVTLYGDGAANQGQKYEALNMSALWKLPAIFVCENNRFGMGTSIGRASFEPNFYKRGDYVPGITCDGQNVMAVKHAFIFAKNYAVKNGPIVIEMDTYRYHGHSMSDPGYTYRNKSDVAQVRKERDPIQKIRELLEEHGLLTEVEMKVIQQTEKKAVAEAVKQSKEAPFPPNEWLFRNVFVSPSSMTARGVDSTKRYPIIYDPSYAQ